MKKSLKVFLIISVCLVSAGIVLIAAALIMGVNLYQPVEIHSEEIEALLSAEFTDFGSEETAGQVVTGDVISDEIRSLDIDWPCGKVEILVTGEDKIALSETASVPIPDNQRFVKSIRGNELVIEYMPEQILQLSVPDKVLTVYLPEAYAAQMQTIKVSVASADCTVSGITGDKFVFDSASGGLQAADMILNYLSADTASGNVTFSGSVSEIICNAASGDIQIHQTNANGKAEAETASGEITLTGAYAQVDLDSASGKVSVSSSTAIRELEIDTASGDVSLRIPSNSAFELEFETASGKFISDLPVSLRGDSYTLNQGGPEFEVSTTSGSLTVLPYVEK